MLYNPTVLEAKTRDESEEKVTYITYHSTGQVNYHGMSFETMFMEPLYRISQVNPFFIISFQTMEAFASIEDSSIINKQNCIVLNLSQVLGKRCNIIFSIAPCVSLPFEESGTIISLNYNDIFRLVIEIVDDEQSFCFNKIYSSEECVKIKPNINMFTERDSKINEAYLKYQHRLYQNDSIIILAPNSEGTLKVIFTVEMRKGPWVKIDFANKYYEIRDLQRSQTKITFKVFDNKTKRFVKTADEINITNVLLDAELYDDESKPPIGFV